MFLINFILVHPTMFAALGISVLDLVFAINPKLDANGILHLVYLQLAALKNKPQS